MRQPENESLHEHPLSILNTIVFRDLKTNSSLSYQANYRFQELLSRAPVGTVGQGVFEKVGQHFLGSVVVQSSKCCIAQSAVDISPILAMAKLLDRLEVDICSGRLPQ